MIVSLLNLPPFSFFVLLTLYVQRCHQIRIQLFIIFNSFMHAIFNTVRRQFLKNLVNTQTGDYHDCIMQHVILLGDDQHFGIFRRNRQFGKQSSKTIYLCWIFQIILFSLDSVQTDQLINLGSV